MRCTCEEFSSETRVQRMSRFIGNEAAEHRLADQREILAMLGNQRMSQFEVIPDAEFISEIYTERFFAFIKDELFSDAYVLAHSFLFHDTDARYRFNIGQRATVKDRNFEVVELNVS